jgi:hypothetical protein
MLAPMSLPAFVSANSSEAGNGFIDSARLIAGDNPPRWLMKHLQRWSSGIMLDGAAHSISPRACCAATILEAWAHFHDGKYPAASNLQLAAAAEEYWRMCGGVAKDWGDGHLKTWRPYFKEASKPALAEIRKKLRRNVLLSAEAH